MFRPKPALVASLNLSNRIGSSDKQMSAEACEFASFLLRYHQDIDYSSFSNDSGVVTKLRRYEQLKYSSELEMLSNHFEDCQRRIVEVEQKVKDVAITASRTVTTEVKPVI